MPPIRIGTSAGFSVTDPSESMPNLFASGLHYMENILSAIYNAPVFSGVLARAASSDYELKSFRACGTDDTQVPFNRGFLPNANPADTFREGSLPFQLNAIVGNLSHLLQDVHLSKKIEESNPFSLPIESESREIALRTHALIASVVHAYIFENVHLGSSCEPVRLPSSMLESFVSSARSLHRPLTQTYETYILQNWRLKDPNQPLSYENIDPLFTYTDSETEKWFIKVHVMSEYYAAPAIKSGMAIKELLDDCLPNTPSSCMKIKEEMLSLLHTARSSLLRFAENIAKIREGCDPEEFFFKLRPYLKNHPLGFFIDGEVLKKVLPETLLQT